MTGSLLQARRPRLLDLFCGAGGASRGYPLLIKPVRDLLIAT